MKNKIKQKILISICIVQAVFLSIIFVNYLLVSSGESQYIVTEKKAICISSTDNTSTFKEEIGIKGIKESPKSDAENSFCFTLNGTYNIKDVVIYNAYKIDTKGITYMSDIDFRNVNNVTGYQLEEKLESARLDKISKVRETSILICLAPTSILTVILSIIIYNKIEYKIRGGYIMDKRFKHYH